MSGTPSLVCSECGHEAVSEKKQLKTRRRWRLVVTCIVVIATGLGAIRYGLTKSSWQELVPTTVLVYLMPELEKNYPKLYNQLRMRMFSDSLEDWQWERLFDRCVDYLSQSALVKVYARPVWDETKPIEYQVRFDWLRTGVGWVDTASIDLDLKLNGELVVNHDRTDILSKTRSTPLEILGLPSIHNSNVLATNNKELIFNVEVNFQHAGASMPWFNLSANKLGSGMNRIKIIMPLKRSNKVVTNTGKKMTIGYTNGPKIYRSYQLHVPVRVVGSSDGSNATPANSSLLKQIRGNTSLVHTEEGIFLTTVGRVWGEPYGVDLALKFEFLYKDEVVASANKILDIDGAGSIVVKLPSIENFDYQALLEGSADDWSVRISGYDKIDIVDLWTPDYWGGEFELPMRVKIEAGKPVPIWSAEDEQTIADLHEG